MSEPGYRSRCLAEHGDTCVRCGSVDGVVAHHINGNRDDNRLDNLAPLCGNCHSVWHRRDNWGDFNEFVDSREAGAIPDILGEIDVEILDLVSIDRVTPTYAADQLDVSREYASDRLKRLTEHDCVEKVAPGLYELIDDPRDND